MTTTRTKQRRVLSPEASKRRSEITRQVKPWEKSTGPRTAAGKRRSRMNAIRHGELVAQNRAFDCFLTAVDHVSQCLHALSMAELGLRPKVTHFLGNVTVGDYFKICAQLKIERPPKHCADTDDWSRYLVRFARARPNDMPELIAKVPLLAVCNELRAEHNAPPSSLT